MPTSPPFLLRNLSGLLLTALALYPSSTAVLAHEGGAHDATHQHHLVQGIEVTLQYQLRQVYLAGLTPQQQRALPASKQVLIVMLTRQQRGLDTRVRLKVTDSRGQAVGAAAGMDPVRMPTAQGLQFVFPVNLLAKQKYFVMVQFADASGIQRSGFELPVP